MTNFNRELESNIATILAVFATGNRPTQEAFDSINTISGLTDDVLFRSGSEQIEDFEEKLLEVITRIGHPQDVRSWDYAHGMLTGMLYIVQSRKSKRTQN